MNVNKNRVYKYIFRLNNRDNTYSRMALRQGEKDKEYVVAFHNTLGQLLMTLKRILPEYKEDWKYCFETYKSTGRKQYIQTIEETLRPYMNEIINQNEEIFGQEYCPSQDTVELIPALDFRLLWKRLHHVSFTNQNELRNTKKAIFTYLRKMYLLASQSTQELDDYYKTEKNKSKLLLKLLNSFKMDKEVRKRVQTIEEKEMDDEQGMFGLDTIKDILGDDIVQPLLEILDSIIHDLKEEFGSLFQKNKNIQTTLLQLVGSPKLKELSQTIGEKVKKTIESGKIDLNTIYQRGLKILDIEKVKEFIYREIRKLNDPTLKEMVDNLFAKNPNEWTKEDLDMLRQRIPIQNMIENVLESYGLKGEEKKKILALVKQFQQSYIPTTTST